MTDFKKAIAELDALARDLTDAKGETMKEWDQGSDLTRVHFENLMESIAEKITAARAGFTAATRGIGEDGWKPFRPQDWHDSGSCYPCLIWDTADDIVFAPCDPWTMNPDGDYATWLAVPTKGLPQRIAPSPTQAGSVLDAATIEAPLREIEVMAAEPWPSETGCQNALARILELCTAIRAIRASPPPPAGEGASASDYIPDAKDALRSALKDTWEGSDPCDESLDTLISELKGRGFEIVPATPSQQTPFAWFKTDVNGSPTDFVSSKFNADSLAQMGFILTPVYAVTPSPDGELVALREALADKVEAQAHLVKGAEDSLPTLEMMERQSAVDAASERLDALLVALTRASTGGKS